MISASLLLPAMSRPKQTQSSRTERRGEQTDLAPEADAEAPAYTIDDLAAKTGIPSRTIRFYQSSGVLSSPDKRGRIAYYGPAHVERLELIGNMQDRGLRMRAIKDLVERIDTGEVALGEWLGLEDQLSSAWIDDAPKVVTRPQLDELLGQRRPGFLAELVRGGLLEAQLEGAYLVPSPGLLQVTLELDDAGVAVDVATGASRILQRHLSKAAQELATFFAERAGDGFGKDDSVAGISGALQQLRTVGPESVRLIFAREMEQVLRRMVETGEAGRIDKKKRRRSKR